MSVSSPADDTLDIEKLLGGHDPNGFFQPSRRALDVEETSLAGAIASGNRVFIEKSPFTSLSNLKPGEVLELRGAFYARKGKHEKEIERFVTFGGRLDNGELCVRIPSHAEADRVVIKAARIVAADDAPPDVLQRIKTAELEANPPDESLARMADALDELADE